MTRGPRVLLAVFVAALAVWLCNLTALIAQDEPHARVYILTSGVVSSADHEQAEGYYAVGAVQIMVPPEGIPALRLRQLCGKRVELAVRELK